MTRRPVHRRQVAVGCVSVRVRWAEFLPSSCTDQGAALVVIPGWSLAVTSRSCWTLYQAFADRAGLTAIAMDSRAVPLVRDSLYQQAEALGRVLLERGLTRVILAGHSQGGALAANLATNLQKQAPALTVDGLMLLDPVGLFNQGRTHLAVAFLADALVGTPAALLGYRAPMGEWLRAASRALRIAVDLVGGIVADLTASGGPRPYWPRFTAEVACLAQRNPHLVDVRCPVVVVQGVADRVSDPRHLTSDRGRASQEVARLFPATPRFCYQVLTTLGLHSLPLLLPEEVAKAALAGLP